MNYISEQKKKVKSRDMKRLAENRKYLRRHPKLTYLFLELTDSCNLHCLHCGSNCSEKKERYMDTELAIRALDEIAEDFDPRSVMICLSGGEPLLHPDFLRIASIIVDMGFPWGVTTNGTQIDENAAYQMKKLGLSSITISIDGIEEDHDWLRQVPGAYKKAVKAVILLHNAGIPVQITSVIHKRNFSKLERMFEAVCEMQVDSWRIINIEPIGRAMFNQKLMLSDREFMELLSFIRRKRYAKDTPLDVRYGCSHYLSFDYEREIRDNYFICGSGIYVGSILCNGDIYSCLDIERRQELVQGNIRYDRFSEIWKYRFKEFRMDRSNLCKECMSCVEREFCEGDATHTWNFDMNEPMFCFFKKTET